MRILVTGGNGYVGRRLCRFLRDEHEICVVDTLRYGSNRFTTEEQTSIRFESTDIRDRNALQQLFEDFSPEAIVHLAAIHYIPECENDPELAVATNVVGTANLASLCPAGCRFVFASSGAVYRPSVEPHRELESPLGPADVYGWTKLHGENYVSYFAKRNSFPACIVRLFNVIGPGETNPHILPEIVAQLKAGRSKLMLGNLSAKRDYIHVADVARGFARIACAGESEPGETCILNLGSGRSYDGEELLVELRSVSACRFEVEKDPSRYRLSDRPFLAANIERIDQLLSWRPQYTLRESLADLWNAPDLEPSWIDRYR